MTDSYGSDLHWLWGWGERLGAYVDSDQRPSKCDWMLFRPDRLANDAMVRLSLKYPFIMQHIKEFLDYAEQQFGLFTEGNRDAEADFATGMMDLADRIKVAVDAIAKAEAAPISNADSADTLRLFSGGVPGNTDIQDLIVKLDANEGKLKADKKSRNEIARKFTGETKGNDPKAQSLLRTIRRMQQNKQINL